MAPTTPFDLTTPRPLATLLSRLPAFALAAAMAFHAVPAFTQDAVKPAQSQAGEASAPAWRHGLTTVGTLKYPEGLKRFDYVNDKAPKGGEVRLNLMGSFDSTNPLLAKGETAVGLAGPVADASGLAAGLVFETLMKPSMDEISSSYGLIAESVAFPEDIAWAKFRLRPEARWADGTPITPEDVIFSFEMTKTLNPQSEFYYKHVVKAEKTAEREVTFTFDETGNKELPHILSTLVIVPKLWWQGQGADGKPRDISRTTLEAPMGSGPYRLVSLTPGSTLRYERNPDYWGKDLPVNVGQNNFDAITFTYFADLDVAFESFRSGNADYRWENSARRWATAYDFPAVKDGRILRESLENENRNSGVMVGFIYNMRRAPFDNPKLREALNYAFDFEELKRTIFFGQYDRIDSFFFRTELASSGLPEGKELEILNSVKDQIPPEVFTKPYVNAVGGDPAKMRDNLRQAIALLKEAGFELKNNRMVEVKTGKPLKLEMLLDGNTIERVALPFAQNLKRIGIDASVRSVDSAQFTNRWRGRDYDMLYLGWAQSLNPGNEQTEYWGSQSATREGSQNFSGISNPGVDALIRKVIFARDRDELIAATHALDRVLLAHHIIVPSYASKDSNIAYAKRLKHPDPLPEYGVGFPAIWWSDGQ